MICIYWLNFSIMDYMRSLEIFKLFYFHDFIFFSFCSFYFITTVFVENGFLKISLHIYATMHIQFFTVIFAQNFFFNNNLDIFGHRIRWDKFTVWPMWGFYFKIKHKMLKEKWNNNNFFTTSYCVCANHTITQQLMNLW